MHQGRFFSHLNSAERLVSDYQGNLPLHDYLKAYFREHPKYGSKDRRQISRLCYAYYRTGNALNDADVKDKVLASLFLLSGEPDPLLSALKPDWTAHMEDGLEDKLNILESVGLQVHVDEIFPLNAELSGSIRDKKGFVLSHLVQPRLFLRIRPGREADVESALRKAGIPFNVFNNTIELANGIDVAGVLELDKDVVVQDLSSQHTGDFIQEALVSAAKPVSVWDCCAASGGKSLMAYDFDPGIELTVSDIRPSILANLSARFARAGIRRYHSAVIDLSNNRMPGFFDVLIADVPCSGSGTWGRTPEMLAGFSSGMLDRYVQMQRSIVENASTSVRPGGQLVYITCSVYHRENEGMVEFLTGKPGWELAGAELIQGWMHGADTLFAARFTRS